MKLRKLTSLAVIATMIMTMTMATMANAADYEETLTIGASDAYNIASYSPSTGTATARALASGAYAGIRKSFGGLTDIANASTVTVEFDTAVSSGSVVVFGFGDATACTAMAGGNGNYKPDGRAIYFGSVDGTNYKAYDVKSGAALNIGSTAFGKVVHARITLDREAGTYSYYIGYSSTAKIEGSDIATDIDNLTYVDAYTKTSGAAFQFKNIKVSYTASDTEPETPTDDVKVSISSVTTNNNPATLQDFIDRKDMVVHVNWYNYTEEDKSLSVVLSYFDADGHFLGYRNLNGDGVLKAGQANSDMKINVKDRDLQGISGNAGGVPAKVVASLWDSFGSKDELNIPYCDALVFEAEPAAEQ